MSRPSNTNLQALEMSSMVSGLESKDGWGSCEVSLSLDPWWSMHWLEPSRDTNQWYVMNMKDDDKYYITNMNREDGTWKRVFGPYDTLEHAKAIYRIGGFHERED